MTRGAYGLRATTPDPRDYRFKASAPYTGGFVDLGAGFPEEPYDQGQLGSCVSNGTAAALDYARAKQGLAPIKRPARLYLYWWGRKDGGYPLDEDTGLEVRDGLKVAGTHGAPPEDTDYPYDIARFTAKPTAKADADAALDVAVKYGQVNLGDIEAAVASGAPVVFGITLWDSFESDAVAQTGVMPVPDKTREQQVGGHCMVIVSTRRDGSQIPHGRAGTRYFRVRNSWGTGWGDNGHVWVPESVIQADASDFWVLTTVNDPSGPTPPNPPEPPPPHDVALVAAARTLASDQCVVAWSLGHHLGQAKHVAALIRAVIKAAP